MSDSDQAPNAREERPQAVALRYRSDDTAPRVVARGYGDIADHIIERAQAHGVFVHRSPDLVRLLVQVDLDDRIPPALYQAVAELLAWIYELERIAAGRDPD
ncbi:MAG: EscU/YscU/HrcU family type III secretion system export apparatus switch protein [Salinisphaera sp.]|jgi:flagellar biosynthesis protein|nr:EscU/YscU/HrcU family type III secretion system export apparatus switch protein [Salinisphaera sp.]